MVDMAAVEVVMEEEEEEVMVVAMAMTTVDEVDILTTEVGTIVGMTEVDTRTVAEAMEEVEHTAVVEDMVVVVVEATETTDMEEEMVDMEEEAAISLNILHLSCTFLSPETSPERRKNQQ